MVRNSPTARAGALAGIAAMLGALVAMQFMAMLLETRQFIDALADGLLVLIPLDWFSWLKSTLGEQAKTWLYAGLLLGFLVVGALGGWIVAMAASQWRRRVPQCTAILLLGAISLQYWFDRQQFTYLFWPILIVLTIGAITWGMLIWFQLDAPRFATYQDTSRRHAIGAVASIIGTLVLGGNLLTLYKRQAESTIEAAESDITPAITPNDQFYRVSKNFSDPTNERGLDWFIEISGQVDEERAWRYGDLQKLGVQHTITTQLCISNTVGGDLIGTAEWTGVPLATVLNTVGAHGDYIRFHGVDGYDTTVPMERCTQPQAWLVWGMNGEPLPESHGAPVRAIIPGLYGMKSVKWLTEIHVTDENALGYWERTGWTNEAVVKPISRIDFPRRTSSLTEGSIPVRGIAFGGDHMLDRVEISTNGGHDWQTATITEQPNPEGIAWSLWHYDWQAEPGTHTLIVRMVDTDGEVQTDASAPSLPDGASGWHKVDVLVARA
ncbi:MAG: molybdopterin-dependent oxidoreductase [Thermomicrobiales bacterium]|nr:molybdopterin-dependent oxidoreductase [Thermomicrobiales bacterium]